MMLRGASKNLLGYSDIDGSHSQFMSFAVKERSGVQEVPAKDSPHFFSEIPKPLERTNSTSGERISALPLPDSLPPIQMPLPNACSCALENKCTNDLEMDGSGTTGCGRILEKEDVDEGVHEQSCLASMPSNYRPVQNSFRERSSSERATSWEPQKPTNEVKKDRRSKRSKKCNIMCSTCGQTYSAQYYLDRHHGNVMLCTGPYGGPYPCLVASCKKIFADFRGRKCHFRREHGISV